LTTSLLNSLDDIALVIVLEVVLLCLVLIENPLLDESPIFFVAEILNLEEDLGIVGRGCCSSNCN